MKSCIKLFFKGMILAGLIFSLWVKAETPVYELNIKNHLFYPSELFIPADTKVKIIIYNRDASPEEFESYELNREKIIMGKRKGIVFIGPLPAGEYPFFGEFNMKTALGKVIVR